MSSESKDSADAFLGFVFFICLPFAVVIGCVAGSTIAEKRVRIEAVERNYAKWVPDSSGETQFVWNIDE